MADITGHFGADFSKFNEAVNKAEIELKSFETGAADVGRALERMGNQFSGRKIIQDATLMVEAVERIGGVTKLTEAEFQRLQRTVGEATEKMRAMGMKVPPELQKITTETSRMQKAFKEMDASRGLISTGTALAGMSGKFGKFSQGIGEVNTALGSLGVAVPKQVQGLAILGTTLSTLASGPIAAVIAAVGAMYAAWTIDWPSVHKKIGDMTAGLLGMGSVARETAAANADVLAKASGIVKRQVTDITEARRIIEDNLKGLTKAERDAAEAAAAAVEKHRAKLSEWLQTRIKQSKEAKEKEEEAAKAYEAMLDRMIKAQDNAVSQLGKDLFGQSAIDKAQQYILAIGDIEGVSTLSAEAQKQVAAAMTAALEAALQLGLGTDEMTSMFVAWQLKATEASRAVEAGLRQVEDQAKETKRQIEALKNTMTIVGPELEKGMSELARPQTLARPQSLAQRGVEIYGPDYSDIDPATGEPRIKKTSYTPGTAPGGEYTPPLRAPGFGGTINQTFNISGTSEELIGRMRRENDRMLGKIGRWPGG
jgi:hypothetical protein